MFVLNLVTPEKKMVTDLEVEEVIVPAFRGQLDILPGHAPLMTTLGTGTLQYRSKGNSAYVSVVVSWGYCQVNPEGVIVLAETAESIEEIDRARAETARKKAETQLMEPILEPDQIARLQHKLERANARLAALEGHGNNTTH
jgi:F-type H+-transporting ATPase subunit epsilon